MQCSKPVIGKHAPVLLTLSLSLSLAFLFSSLAGNLFAQQMPVEVKAPAPQTTGQNQDKNNNKDKDKDTKASPAAPQQAEPSQPAALQGVPGLPKPSQPPAIDPKTMTPLYETIQEDWSSLAVGVSKLKPEDAVVGAVDTQETFTRTIIQVKWRPGDPIDLYLLLPKGVKKPPAVLY